MAVTARQRYFMWLMIVNSFLVGSVIGVSYTYNEPCAYNSTSYARSNCLPKSHLICSQVRAPNPEVPVCLCEEDMSWVAEYDECRIQDGGPCAEHEDDEEDEFRGHCLDGFKCTSISELGSDFPVYFCQKMSAEEKRLTKGKPPSKFKGGHFPMMGRAFLPRPGNDGDGDKPPKKTKIIETVPQKPPDPENPDSAPAPIVDEVVFLQFRMSVIPRNNNDSSSTTNTTDNSSSTGSSPTTIKSSLAGHYLIYAVILTAPFLFLSN